MKQNRIPTIIGLIFLILGLAAGVVLVGGRQFFRLGASAEASPKNVRISNISDSSFTVSWLTDKETAGLVKWGTTSSLDNSEVDEIADKGFTHSATIRGLNPSTTYFFKVNSDGSDFDNNGTLWEAKTGPKLSSQPKQILISGSVLTATGSPSSASLVYISVGGGSLMTTVTSQNGSYLAAIESIRSQDLSSFISIDPKNTLLEISVNAGPDGISSAQIYPQSASPVPPMILGQVHDFKNLPPSGSGELPTASLEGPGEQNQGSGFSANQGQAVPSGKAVTIESTKEGEIVNSTNPEFFGKGPANTEITITVESEPQEITIKIGKNGSWKWTPPQGLSEGTHTLFISWKDANGILRTITKTFVVQASEGLAFVSTPSGSLTPTPTAKATATPSIAPTATPGIELEISPSPSATLPPTLESGSLTPTIVLFIMGVGVLSFSLFIWKSSEIS